MEFDLSKYIIIINYYRFEIHLMFALASRNEGWWSWSQIDKLLTNPLKSISIYQNAFIDGILWVFTHKNGMIDSNSKFQWKLFSNYWSDNKGHKYQIKYL